MVKTNASAELYIAAQPTQTELENKDFKAICLSNEVTYSVSMNKVDKTYFCNEGRTTSFVTGMTESVSVSIDLDPTKEGHKYLYDLFLEQDFSKVNNQYFKIVFPLLDGETTATYVHGKAAIMFKNGLPSGAPTEIVKLDFDILPTDIWVKVKGN